MNKEQMKNEAKNILKEINFLDTFAEIYSKKLGITIEEAKKYVTLKTENRLEGILNTFNSDINHKNTVNKKENISLDEYLKDKTVIKG
jgi:hypothetical protein